MAKKAKERAVWEVDFCQIDMTLEQVAHVQSWDADFVHTLKAISDLLAEGCKISLSRGQHAETVSASVTVPNPSGTGRKACYMAHAPSVMEALKCAAYKFEVVLDGDTTSLWGNGVSGTVWK